MNALEEMYVAKKYCMKCGSEVGTSENYRFCGNCGWPVRNDIPNISIVKSVREVSSPDSSKRNQYYAYARFVSQTGGAVKFQKCDGSFLSMPSFLCKDMGKLKGYYWLWVENKDGKTKVHIDDKDKRAKISEFALFASQYAANDRVVLPVKEVNAKNCVVWIGPSQFVNIPREDIDKAYQSSEIRANKPYVFTVKSISRTEGKYKIELQFSGCIMMKSIENLYKVIPDTISNVVIPWKIVELLLKDTDKRKNIEDVIISINQPNLARFIDEKYQKQKKEKTLVIHKSNKDILIDIDLGIKDVNGVPIKACVNKKEGKDSFVLSLVGGTPPTTELERFVYIPDWEVFCEQIARLALPEKWGYDENDRFSILKSYMKMTYYKARLDGLLYENESGAIFNTGLVDSSFDEIYCYLNKSRSVDDPLEREWTPGFFACRGKGADGKRLNTMFATFPPVPSYIDTGRLENIFFDTSKELYCDYEHIIEDNLTRLPDTFISQTLAYDQRIRAWSDSCGTVCEIKKYIQSKPDLVKVLEDQLKSAIDTAKKYCKWNYKTAIPIYYPRTNNISLLLPLTVVKGSNPNEVDTALVVQLLPNGNYQGQTILTLEMAYKDARQLCRPNSEWLTLEAIRDTVHTREEDEDD